MIKYVKQIALKQNKLVLKHSFSPKLNICKRENPSNMKQCKKLPHVMIESISNVQTSYPFKNNDLNL